MENKVGLSYIEGETIKLLAQEFSDPEIAEHLGIDSSMVRTIISNMMVKTDTNSLIGLIKEAMKKGWIV